MASELMNQFFELQALKDHKQITEDEYIKKRNQIIEQARITAKEIDWSHNPEITYDFKEDKINNPTHYKGKTLEAIQVIEDFELNYNLGNSVKYILRAGKKEDQLADLRKANWYIVREIQAQEKMKG